MHIYHNANPVVELTPDEAIEFANRLLTAAIHVKRMQTKLPGAYEHVRAIGVDPEKSIYTNVSFRLGKY